MSLFAFVMLYLLGLSLVVGLLRRWTRLAGLVAALGMGWLLGWLWQLPVGETATVWRHMVVPDASSTLLEFTFQITPFVRAPLILMLAWGVIFALVAVLVGGERSFLPGIPMLVAALTGFLSVTPLLWAPFWLIIAAVIMGILAQGNRPRPARAALRTLLTPILAFPFFLFTAWVFSQSAVAADDPTLWTRAWQALMVGMLILTSPVPLHGWIPALGESASPLTGAFLVGVWQIAVYTFLRHFLFAYPSIIDFANPGMWLPWIAVIQMLWAGVFMLGSQRLGTLWGYLLLWQFGAGFLTWGLTGELGSHAMFWLFLAAPLAMALAGAGLQVLTQRFGESAAYETLHGGLERLPWATLGFVGGGLFLLGWPLGALFPMRFATWQVAEFRAGQHFLLAMLALTLGVLGMVRAARHLTTPVADTTLRRESRWTAWTMGVLLVMGSWLALNPGLVSPLVERLLVWFNML